MYFCCSAVGRIARNDYVAVSADIVFCLFLMVVFLWFVIFCRLLFESFAVGCFVWLLCFWWRSKINQFHLPNNSNNTSVLHDEPNPLLFVLFAHQLTLKMLLTMLICNSGTPSLDYHKFETWKKSLTPWKVVVAAFHTSYQLPNTPFCTFPAWPYIQ